MERCNTKRIISSFRWHVSRMLMKHNRRLFDQTQTVAVSKKKWMSFKRKRKQVRIQEHCTIVASKTQCKTESELSFSAMPHNRFHLTAQFGTVKIADD